MRVPSSKPLQNVHADHQDFEQRNRTDEALPSSGTLHRNLL